MPTNSVQDKSLYDSNSKAPIMIRIKQDDFISQNILNDEEYEIPVNNRLVNSRG